MHLNHYQFLLPSDAIKRATFLKYREQTIDRTSNMAFNSGPMYPYFDAFIRDARTILGRSGIGPRFESVPSLKMAHKFKSPNPNLSISCFINPCQLFHHRSSDSRTVNMTLIEYDLLWPPLTWENFLTLWTCCIKFFPKHIPGNTLICVEPMLLTRVPWTSNKVRSWLITHP